MIILVVGGSKSGKSMLGQRLAKKLESKDSNLYYIATMKPYDKEDIKRIFERFYRVDKARSREVGGTGLGLAITKHIVKNLDGTINVKSELGQGSEFIITIPKKNFLK